MRWLPSWSRHRRPVMHPYVEMRRSKGVVLLILWVMAITLVAHAHGTWQAVALLVSAVLAIGLTTGSWPWLFYPWMRAVQWRAPMNTQALPSWPRTFSPFVDHWQPIVHTAWSDMDDIRAWLSHHTPAPPEWLVHEEQNIPRWAKMSRNGTCLEEHVGGSAPVLRLWLVLDEQSAAHQPYFRLCQSEGMPLAEIIYGMIAHEMGHAVDVVMRRMFPEQVPFTSDLGPIGEAIADVWEALSTFYPVDLSTFEARIATMARARDVDRSGSTREHAHHDTGRYLRALLRRQDVHDLRRAWPVLPVAMRMRWVWAHVLVVDRLSRQDLHP